MDDKADVVDELLVLAKDPAPFSQDELAEIALVAATEIMKLRGYQAGSVRSARRRSAGSGGHGISLPRAV
ncbi:hypothetical protein [Pseudaminobacter soli (ex Li et al. 2025)]|uniref:Uncharacterized protein n=1 Tax=Pseudaminobacter soli (ex Li et al. 2025) TaxID=1295366 RepID=A0A2P7SA11_9HYPH|nr:hypothetical protein [Mesorhizobium soli]PSJ59324.1 hypothetical protein C7I85_17085 [Mesorhizobium soli]